MMAAVSRADLWVGGFVFAAGIATIALAFWAWRRERRPRR
jgi:hypothetical protein